MAHDDPPTPGAYHDALRVRTERRALVETVLLIQRAFFATWHRWPTAEEVAAQLVDPS